MISDRQFALYLERYGADPSAWPLPGRWLLPLLLRRRPGLMTALQEAQQEQRQWQALFQELPTLAPDAALQTRLLAISARPQPRPPILRRMPAWQLGMTTTLASLLLGFVLGAGGLLLPLDSVAELEVDSAASLEISSWLAEEDQ